MTTLHSSNMRSIHIMQARSSLLVHHLLCRFVCEAFKAPPHQATPGLVITRTHARTHTHTSHMHTCTRARTHTETHHTHTLTHTDTHITHSLRHAHTHTHTHTRTRAHTYTHTRVHAHTREHRAVYCAYTAVHQPDKPHLISPVNAPLATL